MTEQLLQPVRARLAPAVPLAPAPPERMAPAPPQPAAEPVWPLYGATLGGSMVLVVLYAFALYRDAAGGTPGTAILAAAPPVFALALASCALAWAFLRIPAALLDKRFLLPLAPLFIAGATLLAGASTTLVQMAGEGAPLAAFGERLARLDAFAWWIDACLAVLAFVSQAAFAAWRHGQREARAAERAQLEGMALRLRLLQGQLKPHFLFNALNSISALVRTAERELAAQALGQLSELLRHVVHASRHEWLSVASEMAFIEAYLDMQMLRYGERLTIELDIADAPWATLACPPLLFQPLVENAIHHGVERQHRQCSLRMRLALADGAISFSVENPLAAPEERRAGHGLGQAATRERLAILYGEHASLASDASTHTYTATLVFPARPCHAD